MVGAVGEDAFAGETLTHLVAADIELDLERRGETGLALIAEALRRACAAGAIAASRLGAQPSLPTATEVDEILRS